MQGSTIDKKYAVKLYDNRQPEAIQAYFNEKRCLQALTHCQSIVQFEMAGRLQDSLYSDKTCGTSSQAAVTQAACRG